jgi:O-antigen ligase
MNIKISLTNIQLFLFYSLIFLLPFGQLIKLPLNILQINIYATDIIIVFLLIFWGLSLLKRQKKLVFSKFGRPIVAFMTVSSFSLILAFPNYSTNELFISSLYFLRWVSYAGLFFFIISNFSSSNSFKKSKAVYNLLIVTIAFSAFLGLLQYFVIPDVSSLAGLDWDPHYFRLIGTFLDPGYSGFIYLIGLILILAKDKKSLLSYEYPIFFILYLAMVLTYSRSVYLAYFTVLLITAWFKKSKQFLLLSIIILMTSIALLPRPGGEGVRLERTSTATARINNWQQSLDLITKKPVFGYGFNTLRYTQRDLGFLAEESWKQSHSGAGLDSSFLYILSTTGVFGFIVYLWLLTMFFKTDFKKCNIFIKGFVVALISHSLFNNSLFYSFIMIYFWIITGMAAVIRNYK